MEFPSLASPCVELVCIYATYQYRTKHEGCEALPAVSLYIDDAQPIEFTLDETDLSCFENSTGEILVNASGGFPPYNYDVTLDGSLTNYTNLSLIHI